jgi:hypothetical protein
MSFFPETKGETGCFASVSRNSQSHTFVRNSTSELSRPAKPPIVFETWPYWRTKPAHPFMEYFFVSIFGDLNMKRNDRRVLNWTMATPSSGNLCCWTIERRFARYFTGAFTNNFSFFPLIFIMVWFSDCFARALYARFPSTRPFVACS